MTDVYREGKYIGTFVNSSIDKETGILTIKDEKGANLKIGDVMVFNDLPSEDYLKDKGLVK